jgi:hypothetical protein
MPVTNGVRVSWLDPAGFELATSNNVGGQLDANSLQHDFELHATSNGTTVNRTFFAKRS